jgi:valine--pyruvate aminotransferase
MEFRFSEFGRRMSRGGGIVDLMDDLGRAVTTDPDMLMLGGGNPAAIPEVQRVWRRRMTEMLAAGPEFDRALGNYDPPQGNPRFIRTLASMLERELGWNVGPENIAITLGGQTALFSLFNLLAGDHGGGRHRKVLLPLCPEYIGYADQGLEDDFFLACRPKIEWPEGETARVFKYRVDFEAVEAALRGGSIGAIAVSRPTNPTGNVLTDGEIARLSGLASGHDVPLIIDNAYGAPFPGVIFTGATPFWTPDTILTLSLSKIGLPGTRTGIVVGPPPVVSAVASMTGILGLANANLGQRLVEPLLADGTLLRLSREVLRPFYEEKGRQAREWARDVFADKVDYALHAGEGAFFQWLWLRHLPVTTRELYHRLKARRLLVVPGEFFFFGLAEPWPHSHECLRLNISGPAEVVRRGLELIAEEVSSL